MKLYQDSAAPNPRRVRIYLAEKGIEGVELVEVSIARNEQKSREHLQRNPLGLVPVLELDDGRVLREAPVICSYLEELYPDPPLLGTDPYERATIAQWDRHVDLNLLAQVGFVFRNTHPFWAERIPQFPDFGEHARELVLEAYAWLDRELAERPFIAGESFSLADITALCAIDFARISKIRIAPELENLSRWHNDVKSRPSTGA